MSPPVQPGPVPAAARELLRELGEVLAEGGCDARALSGRRYVAAHEAFEAASGQQSRVRHAVELEAARLLDRDPRPLRALSVGCGGGFLDLPLLDHLGERVAAYVGVDPNPHALHRCEP